MRLGTARIKALRDLLKKEFDLDYDDEEAQQAGLAIMRFTLAKLKRSHSLNNKEKKDVPTDTTNPKIKS